MRPHKVSYKVSYIMLVFAVCWLPYQVVILYNEHRADQHLQVPTHLHSASLVAMTTAAPAAVSLHNALAPLAAAVVVGLRYEGRLTSSQFTRTHCDSLLICKQH